MHGMPSSCTDRGGTGKGLRGAGSQFMLLGQQPKSLSRNVAGGVCVCVLGEKGLAVFLRLWLMVGAV